MTVLLVALGGAAGSVARFLVDTALRRRWSVPWPTLAINASASLLLGLLAGLAAAGHLGGSALAVAGTGFCGGYSTFSTAAFELYRLLETGERGTALRYGVASLLLPVLAATAGMSLTAG
ncbi:fluoride efflux transporter FluC [Spongisporangium articulatum]|uniref:Fluoride-specific ion channel FluC n=1 Tax=Spongisporangium articulatum TaxID=3362603 RepID=A0ABW8AKX8_9ACTN